ncbi:MAG: N-acetylmuramoyl-L-alanine amidase [Bacteroidales bacterium]|nr:N-acetylmuramoyl-L-alanine amidase [Bacteroidales bacterium]
MKRFLVIIITLTSFFNVWAQDSIATEGNGYEIKTVVLDAGHGGKDPGAQSNGYNEKDVTLKIVKLLGAKIKKEFPDVNVIYTRDSDVFLELRERTAIANRNHADLFISVHCNANKKTAPYGSETFVMGLHKSKENFEVSKRENASILLEDNYQENYDGYDPNSDESNIIFTLLQNVHLDQSLTLAKNIQDRYEARGRHNRGVKQAGFLVLYTASMPSILTEVGFISNAEERAYLISSSGQDEIAQNIFEAFRQYKRNVEGLPDDTQSYGKSYTAPAEVKTEQVAVEKQVTTEKKVATEKKKEAKPVTYYKIQFMTTSSKINTKEKKFSKMKTISYTKVDNKYKYTTGKFKSKSEAQEYLKSVKKMGYKDAFIVEVTE